MKASRALTGTAWTGMLLLSAGHTQICSASHSVGQIKMRLGHLVRLTLAYNTTALHPREILRLFIHLLQHYCAVDPRPQITQLCATLQGLLQETDSQKILKALEKYCSADLLPADVVTELKGLSIAQQIFLRNGLNKRLKEQVYDRSIHELEQQAFQQCV